MRINEAMRQHIRKFPPPARSILWFALALYDLLEREEREASIARWEDDGGARLTVSTVEGERVSE